MDSDNQSVAGSASARKGFVSPTSSFVEFSELESEVYTERGRAEAQMYDPHSERTIRRPITDFETVVHLLKGSIGAGILAMPKAFLHAGVITGVVGTIMVGVLCCFSLGTLIRMQYVQCQRLKVPFLTYPRSMKVALVNGPKCLRPFAFLAPPLVDFFLTTFQVGICTAYVIFVAESLKEVADASGLVPDLELPIYFLIIFVPVLVLNFIRNLKRLMPISLLANVLIIVAFACCFYFIFCVGDWKYETCQLVSPIPTWPLFLGTVLFAVEAVGVIIALEHNMLNPKHFLSGKRIFPRTLAVVITMYLCVGLLGYLKYGEQVRDTVVASLPQDQWLSLFIKFVFALCIYGTYPLQMYVALEIIWGNYLWPCLRDCNHHSCCEYLMRISTVVFSFLLAVMIPQIDIVISLVGAFCLSTLGITFPFLLELCTRYPDDLNAFTIAKDMLFMLFGLAVLVMGTSISLQSLFRTDDIK